MILGDWLKAPVWSLQFTTRSTNDFQVELSSYPVRFCLQRVVNGSNEEKTLPGSFRFIDARRNSRGILNTPLLVA
jgi:hypothetical protein